MAALVDDTKEGGICLAAPGEAAVALLPPETINLRLYDAIEVHHGSSLSLISKATQVLNDYFTEMDPEKDYKKWSKIGAQIYFLCIFHEGSGTPSSVVRLLLDGDFSTSTVVDSTKCKRRIIIDYLLTLKEVQGRGHGGRLFSQVFKLAERYQANLYVLSLEESCVYWMSKGFVLEEGEINKRLNVFPDTHLLKLPTNREEDPETIAPIELSDEEDNNDETTEVNAEDADSEDDDLQRALLASLGSPQQAQETPAPPPSADTSRDTSHQENDDLAVAMALSMAQEGDEDDQLRLALARSVEDK